MHRNWFLIASLVASACGPTADSAGEGSDVSLAEMTGPYIVDIRQVDYAYSMPAEIPSGWITFRAPNHGEEHHVAVFLRLPEGVTRRDWHEALAALHETGTQAEWWDELEDAGGTGAVAPGLTAETTIWMEPGLYGVLCGVIAPDGTSHWAHGMQTTFEVTEEKSGAPEPNATVRLSLGSDGFQQEGTVTAGTHTVAVYFAEQPELTHDVHVARLGPGQTIQMAVDLMARPIEPFPLTFVGGAEQGPQGRTDYFTVTFEPGRYAWTCHLHASAGMVQEFTVE
jgi:plastocyanin